MSKSKSYAQNAQNHIDPYLNQLYNITQRAICVSKDVNGKHTQQVSSCIFFHHLDEFLSVTLMNVITFSPENIQSSSSSEVHCVNVKDEGRILLSFLKGVYAKRNVVERLVRCPASQSLSESRCT